MANRKQNHLPLVILKGGHKKN